MAKLTKQELKTLIAEKIEDVDLQTELLEDLEDSIDESEKVDKSELDALQAKYDELSEKYRARFLEVKDVEEVIEEAKEDIDSSEEVKEEEIIDVQEI